ncbi:helix-turn-helix transcriptional regulator [bacterium]|nr:helix-turn-helix transcriptional regulator [bacterium]
MKLLSRSEEIVLLAIWQLSDDAYGLKIRDKVNESTDQNWSIGAIYAPLHRLEKKGFVTTEQSIPVAIRGGRRKTIYTVTKEGREAMAQAKAIHESIWKNAPDLDLC